MNLDSIGKAQSWPCLLFAVLAYPIGSAVDRYGAIAVFRLTLWAISLGYLVSFFAIRDSIGFMISSVATGSLLWIVMLLVVSLFQQVFHRERMGQLSGVNSALTALVTALVTSPLSGWYLSRMQGYQTRLNLSIFGVVSVAGYRFVLLMLALLYLTALFALCRVDRHWRRLGGHANYQAPL